MMELTESLACIDTWPPPHLRRQLVLLAEGVSHPLSPRWWEDGIIHCLDLGQLCVV